LEQPLVVDLSALVVGSKRLNDEATSHKNEVHIGLGLARKHHQTHTCHLSFKSTLNEHGRTSGLLHESRGLLHLLAECKEEHRLVIAAEDLNAVSKLSAQLLLNLQSFCIRGKRASVGCCLAEQFEIFNLVAHLLVFWQKVQTELKNRRILYLN